MIVQCPACNSRYRIRDANIPPSGGKIRCPSCAHSFVVYPETPEQEDDSDRTSITNPNALSNLVSKMSSPAKPAPEIDDNSTATLDKDEMNRIRAFQAMAAELGDADDGTLEIKNPMDIWRKAQEALEGGEESEGDDYDAAPTEIVSSDNLPHLPFPGIKPKPSAPITAPLSAPPISAAPAPPIPSAPAPPIPAPPIPAAPAPPIPSAPAPPIPASPKPSASPPIPSLPPRQPVQEPVRAAVPAPGPSAFDDPFARQPSANFAAPTAPPSPQHQHQQPAQQMPQGYGDSTQQLSSPFTGVDSVSSPDVSADIMAAIEEVSLAHDDQPQAAVPDGGHQGPWKLKTDFGLTYEFPDVKSLRNWLSSRDEIDGFKLSADGIDFFSIPDFPQFARRATQSQVGLQQPQEVQPPQPSEPRGMPSDGYAPAAMPNFNQPSFTPPPTSGSFSGPVVPGQYASYHGGPLPPAPMGPPVQTSYQPPSKTGEHKLLWGIFTILLVVCVLVGLQTFGFVDLLGLAGFGKKAAPVVPATKIELVQPIDTPTVEAVNADIESLLKDARRDLKNRKLQTVLDRLVTIETLAPDRPEVFELRAQAYDALGDAEQAESARAKAQAIMDAAQEIEDNALAEDLAATPDGGVDSN